MAPIIQTDDERATRLLDLAGVKYAIVQPASQAKPPTQVSSKAIILEAKQYRGYSYPDLLVPTERSYLNKNWAECRQAARQEEGYMLTPRQFVDFLKLLKSGKAFDENGKKVDSMRLQGLYDEITAVKSPWRAEWLDAKFGDKTITYALIEKDGSTTEVSRKLQGCLMEDKTPGISLDSWLEKANNQGLPTKKTKDGNLYYWHPRKDSVARFSADSGRAYFYCSGYPAGRYDALGVRVARKKI